jgi:hypothetical protein
MLVRKSNWERTERERIERHKREREELPQRESALLLAQFDHLSTRIDPQQRGYQLQDVLNRLFLAHGIAVAKSFQRNSGGEQIDGAFELEGWHYIVECRWREKLARIREVDGLYGQIARSGKQTMGLFLSVNASRKRYPQPPHCLPARFLKYRSQNGSPKMRIVGGC